MTGLTVEQMRRDLAEVRAGNAETAAFCVLRDVEFRQSAAFRKRPPLGWTRFVAATGDVVCGQRLEMVGCDLRHAADGVPFLLGHDRGSVPLGTAFLFVHEDRLIADVRWGRDREARRVRRAYRRGLLRGVSVGTRQYGVRLGAGGVEIVTLWRPTELSATPLPANPACVELRGEL